MRFLLEQRQQLAAKSVLLKQEKEGFITRVSQSEQDSRCLDAIAAIE